jgi:23S rRNA (pseudouridine1915-N3)-methyltransferase
VRVTVVVVGRPRNRALADAIADYEKRAGRYWKLDVIETKAERGEDADMVRRAEAKRLLSRVDGRPYMACDERGGPFNSRQFAEMLARAREAARDSVFVIGGAFGLDREVRDRAELRMSLAPWTLPHELARLVLVEQIYRAGTIIRGEPYHK